MLGPAGKDWEQGQSLLRLSSTGFLRPWLFRGWRLFREGGVWNKEVCGGRGAVSGAPRRKQEEVRVK